MHVFEKSKEKERASLFRLRQTWAPWFPNRLLHDLDQNVQKVDKAWPVTPLKPIQVAKKPNIHVNPAVFSRELSVENSSSENDDLKKMEQELMELKRKKMELEIAAAKKEIAEVSVFKRISYLR